MTQKTLLFVLLMLLIAPASTAAPDGYRLSQPLTARAVKVTADTGITVHCARTTAIWRETAQSEAGKTALGRTNMETQEILLPPLTCNSLEKWLKGKPVVLEVFADALFTFGHELRHATGVRDEHAADCYATRKYNAVARAFGVKRAATLQRLRNEAALIPHLC